MSYICCQPPCSYIVASRCILDKHDMAGHPLSPSRRAPLTKDAGLQIIRKCVTSDARLSPGVCSCLADQGGIRETDTILAINGTDTQHQTSSVAATHMELLPLLKYLQSLDKTTNLGLVTDRNTDDSHTS